MIFSLLAAAWVLSPTSPEPGLPTPPPPLPTYVIQGDGSRVNCTPDYHYCWPEPM